jgi:hypothetical protein
MHFTPEGTIRHRIAKKILKYCCCDKILGTSLPAIEGYNPVFLDEAWQNPLRNAPARCRAQCVAGNNHPLLLKREKNAIVRGNCSKDLIFSQYSCCALGKSFEIPANVDVAGNEKMIV